MKTKLYEEPKLEGNFIELDYGSYKFQVLCQTMSQFKSLELAPHAMITLYSQDNFRGPKHVISNNGNKVLKVTGFENEFNLPIRSIIIECACNLDRNQDCMHIQ